MGQHLPSTIPNPTPHSSHPSRRPSPCFASSASSGFRTRRARKLGLATPPTAMARLFRREFATPATSVARRSARPDPAPTYLTYFLLLPAPRTRSRTSTTPTPSPRPSALTTAADTASEGTAARTLVTMQLHRGDPSARTMAWVFAGVQAFAQALAEAFAGHALASARSSFAFAGK